MIAQNCVGTRLVRALQCSSQDLAGIAFAAGVAIAASDTPPEGLFEELVQLDVDGTLFKVAFVACTCAFNTAVEDSGLFALIQPH